MMKLGCSTIKVGRFSLTLGEELEFELLRQRWKYRITPVRCVLAVVLVVAVLTILYRLIFGLGAATNLNDAWPWGWWIAFDVLCGVALAAGGYTTALIVYVLHRRKFKPIARAALITSMLGYIIVVVGLFVEIGRWYNFWRPFLVYPGGWHSVLFEVFWCVSCYTVVQILEFGHIFFEKVDYPPLKRLFDRVLPALLIIGVLLPTLHQSGLGSLYTAMIDRLDPLWWSLLLPVFFWTSSFFVGPAMCVVEGALAAKSYGHKLEVPVLSSLVRVSMVAMTVYLVLKVVDLGYRGHLGDLFAGTTAGYLCLLELVGGVLVPLILYALPKVRTNPSGLIAASALVVGGVVLNRFNVVFTGMAKAMGGWYFPAWTELIISAGLVSLAVLVYCFIAENFAIFSQQSHIEVLKPAAVTPLQSRATLELQMRARAAS
ncbi:MAG: NrfD/PsrC family molybdoenzyme membrane anchor subunit [Moorellales bacterium]